MMYMSELGRWGVNDPYADKFEIVTPYNYAFNNPLLFVDPNGKENTIYIVLAGGYSASEARKIIENANKILTGLKLKTQVQLFDAKKNGKFDSKNLDKTDNWLVMGTDRRAVAKEAKRLTNNSRYEDQLDTWSTLGKGNPEIANPKAGEHGIVSDPSDVIKAAGSDYFDAAVTILHGAGHSTKKFSISDGKLPGGHNHSGIMPDGNGQLYDYLNDKSGSLIVSKDTNVDYIAAMHERYGTEEAKDNYHQNMVNRINQSRTTKWKCD